MSIDAEAELAVERNVSKANEVLLPRFEHQLGLSTTAYTVRIGPAVYGAVEYISAVNEKIAERVGNAVLLFLVPGAKDCPVGPVLEEEDAEILVVVSRGRAVEDYRSEEAL
jgi:hypothetical protein